MVIFMLRRIDFDRRVVGKSHVSTLLLDLVPRQNIEGRITAGDVSSCWRDQHLCRNHARKEAHELSPLGGK